MRKLGIATLLMFALGSAFISCSKDDSKDGSKDDNKVTNYKTFQSVKVAFGNGNSQSATGTYNFPTNTENISTIKMYIENPCPDKTCDEWDRFANVYVKDSSTNQWYEIGRFITPYWVGSEQLKRGWEIDVTDFKSLLTGPTELKIYTETWNDKGRVYSVNFDFINGTPDYKYSAVMPVLQYNQSSIDGVPYGVANNFDMSKRIQTPNNTELAYLRTIISGWGHATPGSSSGPCAEWCFKTHNILINNAVTFKHDLKGMSCATNPINNQAPGNWKLDRAGWCPGMVVPMRLDNLDKSLFGKSFTYEYKFEPWVNDNKNKDGAFYAISTFVVVKSNTPIAKPVVTNLN